LPLRPRETVCGLETRRPSRPGRRSGAADPGRDRTPGPRAARVAPHPHRVNVPVGRTATYGRTMHPRATSPEVDGRIRATTRASIRTEGGSLGQVDGASHTTGPVTDHVAAKHRGTLAGEGPGEFAGFARRDVDALIGSGLLVQRRDALGQCLHIPVVTGVMAHPHAGAVAWHSHSPPGAGHVHARHF